MWDKGVVSLSIVKVELVKVEPLRKIKDRLTSMLRNPIHVIFALICFFLRSW